jgi:RNA polymerase sigma-70 factor (ECF subfamily)
MSSDPELGSGGEPAQRVDGAASAQLLEQVYGQLRDLAGSYLRRGGANATLQPTAVVHEAFLKLADLAPESFESRAHYFAVAAKAMRQVLTDYARERRALKRGGEAWRRVSLHEDFAAGGGPAEFDVVALDDALEQLARFDPRKQQVVELRFLAGLSAKETAEHLGVSLSTVEAEWRAARAWLATRLG